MIVHGYEVTIGYDIVRGEWVYHAVHQTDKDKWSMGSLCCKNRRDFMAYLATMLQEVEMEEE